MNERVIELLYKIYLRHPEISTDTRHIAPHSLFFALHGASFDGNDFAIEALLNGAAHAVIDRAEILEQHPELSGSLTLVDDTLVTLQELARHHRRTLKAKVLAVSGSNGKTTTKELLREVLSQDEQEGAVYATQGNLNNHIGVPLTLLSLTPKVRFAIVEMGASAIGEIAHLCEIAEPQYGILTNIGRAHLEGFGGEDGVRRAKGELFDYLQRNDGVAFVPCEDATLWSMAHQRKRMRCVDYSYSLADGIESQLEGEYNLYNIAAAVAIGGYFGLNKRVMRKAIEEYRPTNNRSQRIEHERNDIIVDCYNANPSSMESAITHFTNESYPSRAGKVLILGEMRELGEWSNEEHRRVIEQALSSGVDRVILVGEEFGKALNHERERVEYFATRELLDRALQTNPIEGYTILIKGSRGVGLEKIVDLLS